MRVFGELRRRNVFKVSVAYTLLSWLLVRTVAAVAGGDRVTQILAMALILGFPIIVLFAWAYEITPDGLRPTAHVEETKSITADTGRRLNYLLLALLALAAAFLIVDKLT